MALSSAFTRPSSTSSTVSRSARSSTLRSRPCRPILMNGSGATTRNGHIKDARVLARRRCRLSLTPVRLRGTKSSPPEHIGQQTRPLQKRHFLSGQVQTTTIYTNRIPTNSPDAEFAASDCFWQGRASVRPDILTLDDGAALRARSRIMPPLRGLLLLRRVHLLKRVRHPAPGRAERPVPTHLT